MAYGNGSVKTNDHEDCLRSTVATLYCSPSPNDSQSTGKNTCQTASRNIQPAYAMVVSQTASLVLLRCYRRMAGEDAFSGAVTWAEQNRPGGSKGDGRETKLAPLDRSRHPLDDAGGLPTALRNAEWADGTRRGSMVRAGIGLTGGQGERARDGADAAASGAGAVQGPPARTVGDSCDHAVGVGRGCAL